MKILFACIVLVPAIASAQTPHSRRTGNPLEHLPSNIEVLTHFGERADISPDNQRVAFMAKSFGDAMLIDLKTRVITCLTCNVPAAAFLRVMHLVSGDYILIGADHFEDIHISRTRDNELWFLSKERGARPVKLGQKMSEGAAISKKSMKVAFSQTHDQAPDLAPGASRLVTAEVDLSTGEGTHFSKAPGTYNEPEGIFPDGLYTTVEGDRQCKDYGGGCGPGNIDIWKLRLDGTGKDFVRLTHFNDYEGGKASNPVVSTDGRFMAFQTARASDPAGVGYGILLYWFKR